MDYCCFRCTSSVGNVGYFFIGFIAGSIETLLFSPEKGEPFYYLLSLIRLLRKSMDIESEFSLGVSGVFGDRI